MLILKPVNGVWYVQSSGYPQGYWCGYTSEDAALIVMEWMFDQKFDCDGILTRLHFGKLTDRDRHTVAWIHHATVHPTRVVSHKEPIINLIAKSRLLKPPA